MRCYDDAEPDCQDTRGWSMRRGHGRRLKCDHGRESVRGRAAFARTVNVGKSRRVGCYSPGIFAMRKAARSCKNGKRRFERVKAKSWSTPSRCQHLRMYKGAALPECEWHELWEAPEPEVQVGGAEALAMLDQPPQRPWRRRRHRHTLGVGHRVANRSTGERGIITCRRYPFLRVRYDGESRRGVGWHTSKSFTYLGRVDTFCIGDILTLCDDASAVERDLLIFNPISYMSYRSQALAEMCAGCVEVMDTREAGTIVAVTATSRKWLLPASAVKMASVRVLTVQTSCNGAGGSLSFASIAGDEVASVPLDVRDPHRILRELERQTGMPFRRIALLPPDGQQLPGGISRLSDTNPVRLLEALLAQIGARPSTAAQS